MRPTHLEVNLPQLRKNLQAIRAHVSPARVMPMLKANAYGHGLEGVAPFLDPDVDAFGVALVEEGDSPAKAGDPETDPGGRGDTAWTDSTFPGI